MARLVVLQFDDNDEAEGFVTDGGNGYHEQKVVGLFAMPTQFCPQSGSGGCQKNKRVQGWQRGRKFGWWVCSICKKPSGFIPPEKPNELWRRVVSQGVNLLRQPDDQNLETIHDEGWGPNGR